MGYSAASAPRTRWDNIKPYVFAVLSYFVVFALFKAMDSVAFHLFVAVSGVDLIPDGAPITDDLLMGHKMDSFDWINRLGKLLSGVLSGVIGGLVLAKIAKKKAVFCVATVIVISLLLNVFPVGAASEWDIWRIANIEVALFAPWLGVFVQQKLGNGGKVFS